MLLRERPILQVRVYQVLVLVQLINKLALWHGRVCVSACVCLNLLVGWRLTLLLLRYKRVPIFDNRGEDLLGHMESSIAFIEQVILKLLESAFGCSYSMFLVLSY